MTSLELTVERVAQRLVDLFGSNIPITTAVIIEDLGLVNGTQHVLVSSTGGTHQAMYLPALAVQVLGSCFITRLDQGIDDVVVIATNYQVTV